MRARQKAERPKGKVASILGSAWDRVVPRRGSSRDVLWLEFGIMDPHVTQGSPGRRGRKQLVSCCRTPRLESTVGEISGEKDLNLRPPHHQAPSVSVFLIHRNFIGSFDSDFLFVSQPDAKLKGERAKLPAGRQGRRECAISHSSIVQKTLPLFTA